jgi:hypothetical protein
MFNSLNPWVDFGSTGVLLHDSGDMQRSFDCAPMSPSQKKYHTPHGGNVIAISGYMLNLYSVEATSLSAAAKSRQAANREI